MFIRVSLTCTEPGSVPGQSCGDLQAAECWLHWDWKTGPVDLVPEGKDRTEIKHLTKQRHEEPLTN